MSKTHENHCLAHIMGAHCSLLKGKGVKGLVEGPW